MLPSLAYPQDKCGSYNLISQGPHTQREPPASACRTPRPAEMGNCFSDPSKPASTKGGQRLGSGPASTNPPPQTASTYGSVSRSDAPPRTLGGAGDGGDDAGARERALAAAEARSKSVGWVVFDTLLFSHGKRWASDGSGNKDGVCRLQTLAPRDPGRSKEVGTRLSEPDIGVDLGLGSFNILHEMLMTRLRQRVSMPRIPKAGQLSAKLAAERKVSNGPKGDERMMVRSFVPVSPSSHLCVVFGRLTDSCRIGENGIDRFL